MDLSPRRVVPLLWRAAGRRCPNCGSGDLWRGWFRMRAACPRCGLHLERGEQGYIVGVLGQSLIVAGALLSITLNPLLFRAADLWAPRMRNAEASPVAARRPLTDWCRHANLLNSKQA